MCIRDSYDASGNVLSGVTIDGAATRVDDLIGVYEYEVSFDAFVDMTQTVTLKFIEDSFADSNGTGNAASVTFFDIRSSDVEVITPIAELKSGDAYSVNVLNASRYLDLTLDSRTDEEIDFDALMAQDIADLFTLSGAAAENAKVSKIFQRNQNTIRVFFTAVDVDADPFTEGEFTLTVNANQILSLIHI